MIEFFNNNPQAFWFSVGFLLLIVEALVLGFSSGVVMFAGLGALVTGVLLWAALVPPTWLAGIASFGIASAASALLLWKPLLRLQNPGAPEADRSSDLIGHEFRLEGPVSLTKPGVVRYSGVDWRVEIEDGAGVDHLDPGQKVRVASVDVGVFRVLPMTE